MVPNQGSCSKTMSAVDEWRRACVHSLLRWKSSFLHRNQSQSTIRTSLGAGSGALSTAPTAPLHKSSPSSASSIQDNIINNVPSSLPLTPGISWANAPSLATDRSPSPGPVYGLPPRPFNGSSMIAYGSSQSPTITDTFRVADYTPPVAIPPSSSPPADGIDSAPLYQSGTVTTKDKKDVLEEPGIDMLQGSFATFGALGSIIRARRNLFGPPGSRIDVERGHSKTSSSNFRHNGDMQRYQLFDPPVPRLDSPTSDTSPFSSQPSADKPTIKFGEHDIIHSYHRGTAGKDGMAIHELRVVPGPLASPGSHGKPAPSQQDPTGNRLRQQQSLGTVHLGSPSRFDRDLFQGLPATAALPSFSSEVSLPWNIVLVTHVDFDDSSGKIHWFARKVATTCTR
jgi:hypothetical protein